jgi:hypothetical protein
VPQKERDSFWRGYLAEVLPCNHGAGAEHKGGTTLPPPIVDSTEKYSSGRTPISKFEMQILGTRILVVNPSAPDAVLKKYFEKWLKEQRIRSPLPVKRRKKPSANSEVTNSHLSSWCKYNVLAVRGKDPSMAEDVLGMFSPTVSGAGPVSLVGVIDRTLSGQTEDSGPVLAEIINRSEQSSDYRVFLTEKPSGPRARTRHKPYTEGACQDDRAYRRTRGCRPVFRLVRTAVRAIVVAEASRVAEACHDR